MEVPLWGRWKSPLEEGIHMYPRPLESGVTMLPGNTSNSGHCPLLMLQLLCATHVGTVCVTFQVPAENQNLYYAKDKERQQGHEHRKPNILPPCPQTWHTANWHRWDSPSLLLPRLPPQRWPSQFCLKPAKAERCVMLVNSSQGSKISL